MKILQKVCRHCGSIEHFSVAVLSRPGTVEEFGRTCPHCGSALGAATITELDVAEVTPEPDAALMLKTIQRFVE